MLTHALKKNPVVAALGALLLLEVFSLVLVGPVDTVFLDETTVSEQGSIDSEPLKISEIDGPRIDDTAASVVVSQAPVLPGELWVFLFLAYVALLVFNFSYTFERVAEPQWGWEAFYTLITLWGWYALDSEKMYPWFPLLVLKSGLIIFALYAYLLERRLSKPHIHK